MTTVTVVTGDPLSGRKLVAQALSYLMVMQQDKLAFWVDNDTREKKWDFIKTCDDLLLVSSSGKVEKWMEPWFERFGEPLFTIHITRHD